MKQKPIPIVGELKTRANVIAHSWAVAQELHYRNDLLQRLRTAAAEGKTAEQLHQLLDEIQRNSP
jgi:hypothetical protein